MRIAMIGAGNVGGTLGRRWAELGHEVVFGIRDPERGDSAVKGGGALPKGASVAAPADAVRGAQAVVLTTPWLAVPEALREVGADAGALRGAVLLDATNPIGPGLSLRTGPNGESAAEQVLAMAPGANVVKVFNTTGFNNMSDPTYDGARTAMFYAGDDADAKAIARELADALGFEAFDAGGLARARVLENLAVLWIHLAMGGPNSLGREIAFRLVRR
jgi:predicted dinucleotide-binding enzyme